MGPRRIPFPDRKSLTFRLVVGASLLCGATLLAAYVLLTTLFDLHLRRGVDADLVDRLDDLAAGLETTADGGFVMARAPDLPKYERQLSGQYWQVEVDGQPPIRSRSLWDARLPEPPPMGRWATFGCARSRARARSGCGWRSAACSSRSRPRG